MASKQTTQLVLVAVVAGVAIYALTRPKGEADGQGNGSVATQAAIGNVNLEQGALMGAFEVTKNVGENVTVTAMGLSMSAVAGNGAPVAWPFRVELTLGRFNPAQNSFTPWENLYAAVTSSGIRAFDVNVPAGGLSGNQQSTVYTIPSAPSMFGQVLDVRVRVLAADSSPDGLPQGTYTQKAIAIRAPAVTINGGAAVTQGAIGNIDLAQVLGRRGRYYRRRIVA